MTSSLGGPSGLTTHGAASAARAALSAERPVLWVTLTAERTIGSMLAAAPGFDPNLGRPFGWILVGEAWGLPDGALERELLRLRCTTSLRHQG